MAVLRVSKCMKQMCGTEVPDSIRFLAPRGQMQADSADPAEMKTVPLGAGSACHNVKCVIKGTPRLPCLQLPDAKAPMNDFSWLRVEIGLSHYYDSPPLCWCCIVANRLQEHIFISLIPINFSRKYHLR